MTINGPGLWMKDAKLMWPFWTFPKPLIECAIRFFYKSSAVLEFPALFFNDVKAT